MNLVSSLTYVKSQIVDDYFQTPEGKLRLGLVLNLTKLDVNCPTVREWSLVVIRNLCSWSERIRKDLESLKLIGVSEEGAKTLNEMGMREKYMAEVEKLKRKNLDTGELQID